METTARSLMLGAALVLSVFVADAQTVVPVFDNSAGVDFTPPYMSWLVTGPDSWVGASVAIAAAFTPSNDGWLADIDLVLDSHGGDGTWSFTLCEDAGGQIGSALESWSVHYSASYAPVWRELTSVGHTFLSSSNSYFLVASATGSAASQWAWSQDGSTGWHGESVDGSAFNYRTDKQGVFRVNATVIPEPSTYVLLGGVAALVFAVVRRRMRP